LSRKGVRGKVEERCQELFLADGGRRGGLRRKPCRRAGGGCGIGFVLGEARDIAN
jgi:hypothetical protein